MGSTAPLPLDKDPGVNAWHLPCSLVPVVLRRRIHGEPLLAASGIDDDVGIFVLGRNARGDHLAEDLARGLALVRFVLQLPDPGAECC